MPRLGFYLFRNSVVLWASLSQTYNRVARAGHEHDTSEVCTDGNGDRAVGRKQPLHGSTGSTPCKRS